MCVCPSLPLYTICLHIALSASLILSHLYPLFSVTLPPRHQVCPSIHLSSLFLLLPSFKFFTSLPPRQSRVLNPTAWLASVLIPFTFCPQFLGRTLRCTGRPVQPWEDPSLMDQGWRRDGYISVVMASTGCISK